MGSGWRVVGEKMTEMVNDSLKVGPLRIGNVMVDPPLLQAPMAGFTNYAFRQIVRGLGGLGLPATEMVSARGFVHMDAQKQRYP